MTRARRVAGRQVHRGRIVDLSVDRVRLPNGNECELELIRHPGASAVAPIDADNNVLLVRQYRYAADGYLLEVPAGKLDGDEGPGTCAHREVEEETGYRPGRLIPLGWIWTTPGFTNEKIWLYLATDLERSSPSLQPDEILTVEKTPFDVAVAQALNGEIHDAKSVCTLLRAAHHLGA
jgi:ADP-ribose pyrophosphatase